MQYFYQTDLGKYEQSGKNRDLETTAVCTRLLLLLLYFLAYFFYQKMCHMEDARMLGNETGCQISRTG